MLKPGTARFRGGPAPACHAATPETTPAGTPKPVIDKLNAAVGGIVKRPDIVKLWTEQGAVPMSMSPDEFDRFLRGDIVKWAEVAKKFDKS